MCTLIIKGEFLLFCGSKLAQHAMNWANVDSLRDGVDKRGMKTTGTSDTEITDWVLGVYERGGKAVGAGRAVFIWNDLAMGLCFLQMFLRKSVSGPLLWIAIMACSKMRPMATSKRWAWMGAFVSSLV